jgi:hypothetical protein
MRIVDLFDGMARCISVDQHGCLRQHFHYVNELMPLKVAIGARSTWPEMSHLDLREIEDEERRALADRKASEKAARKSRRSKKIKRPNHAPA